MSLKVSLRLRNCALAALFLTIPARGGTPSLGDLETAFGNESWSEAAQIAHEILSRDKKATIAKINGGYALFQKGYANAALLFLNRLTASEWKLVPEGSQRLAEIVSLFQKKIPLNTLGGRLELVNVDSVSPALKDEVYFAKGRIAFEKRDANTARSFLSKISKKSRFYGYASYLLGTIALSQKQFKTATSEMAKIMEPSVFQEASEFWSDIQTQTSAHWGPKLTVSLDEDALVKASQLSELGTLGMARIAYASKNFEKAVKHYEEVSAESSYYGKATFERVWALLALNRHDAAQQVAKDLSTAESYFESIKARPLRALILVDSGKWKEGRQELDAFLKVYADAKARLKSPGATPEFLSQDLNDDARLQTLIRYKMALIREIAELKKEDANLFPVFRALAGQLGPLVKESESLIDSLSKGHVTRRLSDLERLKNQCHLIRAESFLEEREALRAHFKSAENVDESEQLKHDEQLVSLLSSAIKEVDVATSLRKGRHPSLEFRQSELLWELSTAMGFLSLATKSAEQKKMADDLKQKSISLAEDLAVNFPKAPNHAQSMFFTAFARLEFGRIDEGVEMLEDYVQKYPSHPHVPDAYRMLGDVRFDANDFKGARAFYQRIAGFKDSGLNGYALYKIAWCDYNLRDPMSAMGGFERAVLWANESGEQGQLLNLKKEARHDLISIYAEDGDHRLAMELFQRLDKDDVDGWLEELATQLDTIGQFEKSTYLYRQLIQRNPKSPENLRFQTLILKGAYKLRQWQVAVDATKALTNQYKQSLAVPVGEKEPAFLTEATVRELVLSHLYEVEKTSAKDSEDRVLDLNTMYLDTFADWPAAREVLYQHAYYLLKKGHAEDAIDAYEAHWAGYQAALKEPLKEESLRNLINACEKAESTRPASDKLDEMAQKTIQYTEAYAKLYGNTRHARAIAFLKATTLLKHKQWESGLAETQRIFDQNSQDDIGKRAFKNLRVAYYDRKDWKELNRWAEALSSRSQTGNEWYAADLKTIKEESAFLSAEDTEDDAKAAGKYLAIARDPQTGALREKGLYNAFVRYQKAGLKFEALKTAAELEKLAPQFPELAEIAGVRAAMHLQSGDYERAYPLLSRFMKAPKGEVSEELIAQAKLNYALIAEAAGDKAAAEKYFQTYLLAKGATQGGQQEAKRGMDRLSGKAARKPAAITPEWEKLIKGKAAFDASPLPKKKDLGAKIQEGGQQLEKLAKQFIGFSREGEPEIAVEAFCAIPLLYARYAAAVSELSKSANAAVKADLAKIATPLQEKAQNLGNDCIAKSGEAELSGAFYRQALEKWGWLSDKNIRETVTQLEAQLTKGFPWLERQTGSQSIGDIVKLHLTTGSSAESWYALGLNRWRQKQMGLARLSFVDGLQLFPESAPLLNALGSLEMGYGRTDGAKELFQQATSHGSKLASLNLALYHLKGLRLEAAKVALKQANESGGLDGKTDLKPLVEKLVER